MRLSRLLLLPPTLLLAGAAACGHGSAKPDPSAAQPPTDPEPAAIVCDPTPPPLYGIHVKIHQNASDRKTLDSRPIVINLGGYCGRAGFGELDKFCFTRREGDPMQTACDYLAVGRAADTGRWGPTWYYNGQPCTDPTEVGCNNHPSNQFLVISKGTGEFSACAAPEIPLSQDPERPGSRCGVCRIPSVDSSECQ
jgi:hypothetical protein